MKYKVGDEVRSTDPTYNTDEIGVINSTDQGVAGCPYDVMFSEDKLGSIYFNDDNLELVNKSNHKKGNMIKLTEQAKKALSVDDQALMESGFIDKNFVMTGEGDEALMDIIAVLHKELWVKAAKKKLSEEKKEDK